jgi:hypothetical protein
MTKRILAMAALAWASMPAFAAKPLETIDVLCGGADAEERAGLEREVRAASVALEFFSGTKGNYVADVDVLFTPLSAPVEAFGIVTNGPVCLLELPPGEYRVNTWFNGHSRTTTATIPAKRDRLVRVSLGFPEDRGSDALLVPTSHSMQQAQRP